MTAMNDSPASAPVGCRLVVLAPNAWRGQWVNRQQLFSRLGRTHTVLYSTGGWFTWDRHRTEWRTAPRLGAFERADNVWVDESPRALMRFPRFLLLDGLAIRMQARRWARFMRKRGTGPLVAYVFHPMFLPYVRHIGAKYVVYHAYDLYEHTPGWNETLAQDQRTLLRSADMVVAASEQIAQALRAQVERDIRVLPNGADVEALSQALSVRLPEPQDLAEIPHPRLGWVGSLHPQVDFGLIADLAARRPEWNFVLVGNLVEHSDPRSEAERARCVELPNVHFLGAKPVGMVPQYLVNMDVNLMFYRLAGQSWVTSGYPLKLHEYLAVGHPVVSVDLPTVRPFADVVRIADGVEDWLVAIQEALTAGGRGTTEHRRAVAAANGWDQRVARLDAMLKGLVKDERGGG